MMMWSERRGPRMREMAADAATIAWVGLWAVLGIRLYGGLAELAGAGRLIRDGGVGLRNTGGEVAGAVQGIPSSVRTRRRASVTHSDRPPIRLSPSAWTSSASYSSSPGCSAWLGVRSGIGSSSLVREQTSGGQPISGARG